MRAAAIGLGGLSALLGIIVGLQLSELSSLRDEATSLRRELSECRIEASRAPKNPSITQPAGNQPVSRPRTIEPQPTGTSEASAAEQLQRAFDEAAKRPPPPPSDRSPKRGRDFDMPESLAEAREIFVEEFDAWASSTDATDEEIRMMEESITPLFDSLSDLEQQVTSREMDLQDASREAGALRNEMIADLRAEVGDDAFKDMWRSTGVGKLLRLHTGP